MPKGPAVRARGRGADLGRAQVGPTIKGTIMNLGNWNKGSLVSAKRKGEMESLTEFKPNGPHDVFSTNLTKEGTLIFKREGRVLGRDWSNQICSLKTFAWIQGSVCKQERRQETHEQT